MPTPWIDGRKLGPYTVQKKELPRSGGQAYLPLSSPKAFVVHTTEGSSVAGAIGALASAYSAPHFVVGENRIVQTRPLTAQAATLRSHNDVGWQVESVGFSKTQLYTLPSATWGPLVEVSRFVHEELGVPLARPDGWRDDCSDMAMPWSADNRRRKSRDALGFRGFVGHVDIPDQDPTWHWDPGALNYTELFAAVSGTSTEGEDKMLDDYVNGQVAARTKASELGFADIGPARSDRPVHWRQGWGQVRWEVNNLRISGTGVGPHKHAIVATTEDAG